MSSSLDQCLKVKAMLEKIIAEDPKRNSDETFEKAVVSFLFVASFYAGFLMARRTETPRGELHQADTPRRSTQ